MHVNKIRSCDLSKVQLKGEVKPGSHGNGELQNTRVGMVLDYFQLLQPACIIILLLYNSCLRSVVMTDAARSRPVSVPCKYTKCLLPEEL